VRRPTPKLWRVCSMLPWPTSLWYVRQQTRVLAVAVCRVPPGSALSFVPLPDALRCAGLGWAGTGAVSADREGHAQRAWAHLRGLRCIGGHAGGGAAAAAAGRIGGDAAAACGRRHTVAGATATAAAAAAAAAARRSRSATIAAWSGQWAAGRRSKDSSGPGVLAGHLSPRARPVLRFYAECKIWRGRAGGRATHCQHLHRDTRGPTRRSR
jgi:hypothetical protein